MIPDRMTAVLLTGHGGLDKLELRDDLPVPTPAADEVLIRVLACGINNTDINTRIDWYSKTVTGETGEGAAEGLASDVDEDASWAGLADIQQAQSDFLAKAHTGKLVLVPPR